MWKQRLVIFGVGQKFKKERQEHKELFERFDTVAYLDNNSALWGTEIDGVHVMSPSRIQELEYDKVVLMVARVREMREQLVALGVPQDSILLWDQMLCMDRHGVFIEYGRWEQSSKAKVLMVSCSLGYDGGTIAILNAAKALKMQGYDAAVAAAEGNPELIREMASQGMHIVIIPAINFPEKEELDWAGQFDVVIVNVFPMIRCACIISHVKPVIWWIHESSDRYTGIYSHVRDIYSEFDNLAALERINILAVSSRARDNFNRYYTDRIKEILPYGIPDTHTKKKGIMNKKTVFSVIGTIHPVKAQMVFLDAVLMLDEKTKGNAEFWVIGKYTDSPYFDKVYEKAKAIPEVKMLGELTREQMRVKYEGIDVVVCSSMEETMSLTVTEGMMNGKVCITTDTTGMADYIEDGVNGLICEAGDVGSLCKKMEWILEHSEQRERIGENARKTYEEHFTMEKFGIRLQKAVVSAMEEKCQAKDL